MVAGFAVLVVDEPDEGGVVGESFERCLRDRFAVGVFGDAFGVGSESGVIGADPDEVFGVGPCGAGA